MPRRHETRDATGAKHGGAAGAAATGGSDYLTIAQAAAILGCSPKQVRRLIDAGRIPAIDVGVGRQRSYRLKRADLETNLAVPAVPAGPQRRGRRRLSEIRYVTNII